MNLAALPKIEKPIKPQEPVRPVKTIFKKGDIMYLTANNTELGPILQYSNTMGAAFLNLEEAVNAVQKAGFNLSDIEIKPINFSGNTYGYCSNLTKLGFIIKWTDENYNKALMKNEEDFITKMAQYNDDMAEFKINVKRYQIEQAKYEAYQALKKLEKLTGEISL